MPITRQELHSSLDAEIEKIGSLSENIKSHWVNVKYPPHLLLGAKGDGISDDTSALQSCINYCIANKLRLFIPSGVYIHTDLTIDGLITIIGENQKTTVLEYVGTGTSLKIGDPVPSNLDNKRTVYGSMFKDFIIKTSKNAVYGMAITRLVHSSFENIRIEGSFNTGVYIYGNENDESPGNSVFNNRFRMVFTVGVGTNLMSNGFKINGIISDTYFDECGALTTNYGMHFYGMTKTSWNVNIEKCSFVEAKTSVFFDDIILRNLRIVGCNFENFRDHAIKVSGQTANNSSVGSITNNTALVKTGFTAISCFDLDNVVSFTISNNAFVRNSQVDILLGINATVCTLFGNRGINKVITKTISPSNTWFEFVYTANQNLTRYLKGISVEQGDFVVEQIGKGTIVTTPDGSKKYRISVDNEGAVITTLI